jgi:hypothetical protein
MQVRMTDAPKKRFWFQFHLSTAIVMMFVAGVLLGLNVVGDMPQPQFLYDLDRKFDATQYMIKAGGKQWTVEGQG